MKIRKRNISNFIHNEQRNFALYTISSRGLPSALDLLINSERLLILNAPKTFNKSLNLIGSTIQSGYHHGDLSLSKTMNRLASKYNSSTALFDGDGFFGSLTCPKPAAPRYTSTKINPVISNDIEKLKHIQTKNEDGIVQYLPLMYPIGLCISRIGIATGFSCTILPRKREDILKYLSGEKFKLKPSFDGFTGKIELIDNKWVFYPVTQVSNTGGETKIYFKELCPLLNFSKFLERLDKQIKKINNKIRIKNLSAKKINIEITLPKELFKDSEVIKSIIEVGQTRISENITVVWNNKVVEYETIEDYLDDFKLYTEHLHLNNLKWKLNFNNFELIKNICLFDFVSFFVHSSNSKKTNKEVDDKITEILNKHCSGTDIEKVNQIKLVLTSFLARNLNIERIKTIAGEIKKLEDEIKELEINIKNYKTTKENIEFNSTRKSKIETVDLSEFLIDLETEDEDEIILYED